MPIRVFIHQVPSVVLLEALRAYLDDFGRGRHAVRAEMDRISVEVSDPGEVELLRQYFPRLSVTAS